MDDSGIIELYWQRSDEAVRRTAEKYGGYCSSIAVNILQNRQDAEECVNDTYMRAWESIPPNRPERLSAYLGRITRNLALNMRRAGGTKKRGEGQTELILSELGDLLPSRSDVESETESGAVTAAVNAFLYSLPRNERNVFILRYWYMQPLKDIASKHGISESKAASMLFRTRKKLRAHLEKEGIEL